MYEAFFGLKERPFNLTPDPKYLYLSEKHKEAFAHLMYGIKNRSGFVMITGEIGTGKTTLCRNLLNQLDSGAEVAFIFNPFLEPLELLKKINQEFGIQSQAATVLGLTEELNEHLLHSAAQGKNCVLVIDEAQNLSPQVLEQIRLLSNIETDSEKLLQIILIGQPELAEKLQLQELRQLNQRITARYHLKSLNMPETLEYIAYRLYVAGGKKRVDFTRQAAKQVFKSSGGVPRMINALCDRALLIGYTREQRTVTGAEVRQAMQEIRGERVVAPKNRSVQWRRWLPAPSMALVLVLAFLLTHYLVNPLDRFSREMRLFNAILSGDVHGASKDEGGLVTAESIESSGAANEEASNRNSGILDLVMARLDTSGTRWTEQSLAQAIVDKKPGETLRAGIDLLMGLWEKNLAHSYPPDDSAASLTAFFDSQGLACESITSALGKIYGINLPGLARMRFGEVDFWVAMVRMDEETVTLLTGSAIRVTVSYEEFQKYYRGELLVPWRDPVPEASLMALGHQGPAVRKLKEKLAGLRRLNPGNTTDIYDQETQEAVQALQNEAGLKADGIAGRQMRLVLSSWESGAPVLHPRAVPASPVGAADGEKVSVGAGRSENTPAREAASAKNVPEKKVEKGSAAVVKTPVTRSRALAVIETASADPGMSQGASLPPVVEDLAAMAEQRGTRDETGAPEMDEARKRSAAGELPFFEPLPENPAGETAPPDGGGMLMQVRDLPEPSDTLPAVPEEPDLSVTKPVPGSMPLVPHEESASL
ncbi:MAG: putative peptidoglycan binding domain protein [Candidatus Hydrogenedentes bacterium ADurb.Bin101]|nr:MAG: putative peptidoglycan binding domain protein [Candidatus Hydrogenedentes bacterium ADurb.Bin101]